MTRHSSKIYLILSLAFFLLALLFHTAHIRTQNEAAAAMLAPQVLRFHIMANSDSAEDQDVKLEIRSLVLDYMKQNLTDDADKEETSHWLMNHQTRIEQLADTHLKQRGFDYNAHLELTNCYFPTRSYNGLIFPCGNYDAARITLGKGNGHNWWCVLYPRFCLMEETWASIPDNALSSKTNPAAYTEITKQDGAPLFKEHHPTVKFRIKLLELLNPD